jgi:hypothetical protein
MTKFFVVIEDKLGEEFAIEVMAGHWQDAFEKASSKYPESMVVYVSPIKEES